ncbi:MAG TPA: ATP-binding protein [Polyangiaceae bacterium]|nr:ATP-binding protein [Polyangiaceae bacterium]
MKSPRSIERNLLSFGLALASLIVVLVIALFAVEHALGNRIERLGTATVPAAQAATNLRHAVSRVFERQVQVLSTRTESELAPLAERSAIERALGESRQRLSSTLKGIAPADAAERETARLSASIDEVLTRDASLFDSVRVRHGAEAKFEARAQASKASLDQLIQEARAVAGLGHLEYVLELRRVAGGASPELVLRGNARAQQEAAEQVVTAVLQLGQLMGKIALAKDQDELNSITANELAQNLSRARTQLKVLVLSLEGAADTAERARKMQSQFDAVAAQISAEKDAQSLVSLRRSILVEASHASALRAKILDSVKRLSGELDLVERIVADETSDSMRAARRALWVTRTLSLLFVFAAVAVGFHAARRLRDSVRGLRAQNQELASLSRDLKQMNEGLEALVAERSAALVARERSMRLVLDAMSEGLVLADLSGNLVGESSKASISWFGAAPEGTPIWDYLLAHDVGKREAFRVGFAQIAEDLLPFEVSVDCMPRRFELNGRVFSLGYRQVREDDVFQRVLVVVKDISEQVAGEERERDAREQHQLLAHLLKDKQGFLSFVRDAERLLATLRGEITRDGALRTLHTLKGNTGVFGMESVARRCHELEERLTEREDGITETEAKELVELWRARLSRVEGALTRENAIELYESDLVELVSGLRGRRDYPQLIELVESWKWTRTSVLLRRLAAQVHRVGERLNKHVEVRIEHNNLRVMPGALDDFWGSLIHVIRNAVDHGIETEAERAQQGKPAHGIITLRTTQLGEGFAVELADDGRGIAFDDLRRIAEARGLPSKTRRDLLDVMFSDGVSTREQATDTSGRGVGLGAVVAACRAAGGMVDVDSGSGKGTSFKFAFPKQAVEVRVGASSGTFHTVRPRSLRAPSNARNAE